MNMCKVDECSGRVTGFGYCQKHYVQYKRHGKVLKNSKNEFNEIVDKGTYYEIILVNNKYEEVGRAKIDKEDLNIIKQANRWCLTKAKYAGSKVGLMHRLIMNAEENDEVDHKKVGIKYRLDNRKKNLRIATKNQNQYNRTKYRNNKSGFKGVSLHKRSQKWYACIQINGKGIHLGSFDTPEEASKAYQKAAKKHHKEFYNKEKR